MMELKNDNGRVLVFIPTFNDIHCLVDIVNKVGVTLNDVEILIIDDGSTIPLHESQYAQNSLYVRLPDNFGLGACTHIAFDHALNYEYRAVIRVDADGQHPLDKIPNLLALLDTGDADVVVGSRTNRNSGQGYRAMLGRWIRAYFSVVARLITKGRSPLDVNSGFFAANRKAIEILSRFRLERFPEPQIYMLACRNGLSVREILVEQEERRQGTSRVDLVHALRLFYRFNVFVLGELLQGRRDR